MSALRLLLFLLLHAGTSPLHARPEPAMRILMNFDAGAEEPRWVAVNDGVMGGLSRGGPVLAEGHLRFAGDLSLANNGGFSSVRTVGRDFDLQGVEAVVLRVRGDGRSYQLRLATDARFRGITVSWSGEFTTVAGQWTEVRLPLAALNPSAHGMALRGPALDPAQVREIGLLIGDKREGPFRLDVDWIALDAAADPRL